MCIQDIGRALPKGLGSSKTDERFVREGKDGEPVRFESGGLLGCPPDEPLTLVTYDHKMQNIALDKGWNWISFNVKPGEHAMSSLFTSNETFEVGDYVVFKNRSDVQSTVYSEYMGMGRWSNNDVLNADPFVLCPGERLGSLTGSGYAPRWR